MTQTTKTRKGSSSEQQARINASFNISGPARELLETVAASRMQRVGQCARDLALLYLQERQNGQANLQVTLDQLATDLAALKTKLAH